MVRTVQKLFQLRISHFLGPVTTSLTTPLWGRSEVGEGGFLLLELRQVRGELDDQ